MKKAFMVSSSGGHFAELKKIKIENYELIYIIENKGKTKDPLIDHTLIYGSRSKFFSYIFISTYNFFKALLLFIRYRPKLLVSTGAHSCVVFFYLAKIFRTKSVYVESFQKVTTPSLTYTIISPVVDKTIVQQPELLEVYKDSVYFGGLF